MKRWWGLIARSSRGSWVSPRGNAPRRGRLGRIACLAGWLFAGLFGWAVVFAGQSAAPSRAQFDQAALEGALSRPIAELRQQGPDAVRSHLERLTEIYAALDGADGVPQAERQAIRDRILTRVAEIGQQGRDEGASAARTGRPRGWWTTALSSLAALDVLGERSVLPVGLLGGLIVAYALGRLAGYRRGASEASYYGAGDPRVWFTVRARDSARPVEPVVRIGIDQIRSTLAAGRTVLLQLGYEIMPSRRKVFLGLIREMQRALNELDHDVYSAWEDPRHPNRFYEVVVCRSLETLELLTSERSQLADLDADIEACWRPGRPVFRRAWWRIASQRGEEEARLVGSASSARGREERAP